MNKTNDLQAWATRIQTLLVDLQGGLVALANVPQGGEPSDRASKIIEVWRACRFLAGTTAPHVEALHVFTARGKDSLEQFFPRLAFALTEELTAALAALPDGADPTGTFFATAPFVGKIGFWRPQAVDICVVPRDALAPTHPLRSTLQDGDCYRLGTEAIPSILLGAAIMSGAQNGFPTLEPAPFYVVADAVSLTKSFRQPQRIDEDARARQLAADARRAEEAKSTDRERIRQLERQLAQLLAEREQQQTATV